MRIGAAAGSLTQPMGKKYLQLCITINGKQLKYLLHRVVWMFVTGEDPGDWEIDHIDGNGLNNSFANLRKANRSQNMCNSRLTADNSSGFKGVSYCKQTKKWKASIQINGKQLHLGRFDTPEPAHMAYCKAAAELHGEFARGA